MTRIEKSESILLTGLIVLFLLSGPLLLAQEADAPPIDSHFFGGMEVRQIGPAVMGGRVTSLTAVDSNPRTIYVGTAGGGIWKSTNGGTTFAPIFDDYAQSIGAVAVDPSDPETVWVGTGESWTRNSVSIGDGLYKSTDGGENWALLGLEDSERIADIIIHPENSDIAWIAVTGHLWDGHPTRGVYKTTDGGKSFEQVLYVDQDIGCADLAIDPQEPDTLYAAMWQFRRSPDFFVSGGPGSGLYRSRDGGSNWEKMTTGLPQGDLGRIGLAVAPSRPNIVYAVVESEETALYRSEDLGRTWEKRDTSGSITARPFYFAHLVVDPEDPNRLYKASTFIGVSNDGGQSFSLSPIPIHPDIHAFWISPRDPNYVLVGTDGGVYVSRDRAQTWRFLDSLPVSQFYHVSYDMEYPYQVYGGLQDNGSWMGPSSTGGGSAVFGIGGGGIRNRDWTNVGGGDGFNVIPDLADPDIVYYQSQGGNLLRFNRLTRESKAIKPVSDEPDDELRFNWNTPLVLSSHQPARLYAGAQYLFQSDDRGESWKRISPDLTTDDPALQRQHESGGLTLDNSTAENHTTIYTISESPLDPAILWVGTDDGRLHVTRDGGTNWKDVSGNLPNVPPGTWVSSVQASHHDPRTAYATLDGHRRGDMSPYLFGTNDFGKTWASLVTDSLEGYAHIIKEDPGSPSLLFLGTEFGLFISLDGGQQWAHFRGNLPRVAVRDIAVHPREADLILATHGRGIAILDDLTPLRAASGESFASEVVMLPSRPARIEFPFSPQTFEGHTEFVGPNPSEVATIHYYLRRRHVFGDMRLEIYGPDGELVSTVRGGRRRGINRVAWEMREKGPPLPPSGALATGFMRGPIVPEGAYEVRLVKGEKTYGSTIDIVGHPLSPHSQEDRLLQQRTVKELYDLLKEVSFQSERLSNLLDQIKKRRQETGENSPLKQELDEYETRIESLYQKLVLPETRGITVERRIRTEVMRLYGEINGYSGRPSQSQLDHFQTLQNRLAQVDQEVNQELGESLASINEILTEAGLEGLVPLTRVEFDSRE